MRRLYSLALLAAALVFAATACGPKVHTTPLAFDEDLSGTPEPVEHATDLTPLARPIAPAGPGLRTGTITRAQLDAVLDAGPASLLRQFEVAPKLDANRFVGWTLVQLLDPTSGLATLDLEPGDVLLAVNGTAIAHPDQLQAVWAALRTANHVSVELWRGTARFALEFTVEPARTSLVQPAAAARL